MPTYLYRGTVDPSHHELRRRLRAEHLAYQATLTNLAGGPLTDDDGEVVGTMIVFEAADRAAAEARIVADPFVAHHVVTDWNLDVFVPVTWPT